MFINSHIATGYIVSRLDRDDKMLAAIIPDIDGLWSKSVVDHYSLLHTPFFWLIIYGTGWLIGYIRVDYE